MTLRFTTSRAIGAAIALTISAGALSAQTPTTTPSSPTTPTTGTTTGTSTGTVSRDTSTSGTTTGTTGSSSTMGSSTMGSSTMQDTTRRSTTASPSRVRKDGSSSTMGGTPVRKESAGEVMPTPAPEPAPAPAPAPEPAPAPAPMDTSMSTTTTTTTTTTLESTGETQPPMRVSRFGNGLYFGLQGGANFPQNDIGDYYETGYGAGAQMGWDPANSPLGLRVNAMWNRLNGRDLANTTINNVRYEADLQDADLYSVFADAKLRLPFGRFLGATSGLYAVGGGGVTYFRNYNNFGAVTGTTPGQNVTGTFNPEDVTRFSLNGGGGLSFGVGAVSLFVEGRYVRTFTQGRDTDFVPVTLGITFH